MYPMHIEKTKVTDEEKIIIRKYMDQICEKVGSRNRVAGILDMTTQQYNKYHKSCEINVKVGTQLAAIIDINWKILCPVHARLVEAIEQHWATK